MGKKIHKKDKLINDEPEDQYAQTRSILPTAAELGEEWRENEMMIANRSKYPLFWKLPGPEEKKEMVVITPPPDGVRQYVTEKSRKYSDKRPRVAMEISHKHFGVIGRMVIKLYSDYSPKTCQNFLAFCNDGLYSYKGCYFYRIFPDFFCITGDVVNNKGLGGLCVNGSHFHDENYLLSHGAPGVVSMHNTQRHQNGSQFLITFKAQPCIDGRFVAFGKVITGLSAVKELATYGTPISGYPSVPLWISKIEEI